MTEKTLARVNDVFKEVFSDEDLSITRETTAPDVPGWDSLMHVTLVLSIERAFGIRFKSSEVAGLQNVGELLDLIEAKS
jgi:acyl carrier protein